jgi:hypothetical protein
LIKLWDNTDKSKKESKLAKLTLNTLIGRNSPWCTSSGVGKRLEKQGYEHFEQHLRMGSWRDVMIEVESKQFGQDIQN